jgi:hypothetical protein
MRIQWRLVEGLQHLKARWKYRGDQPIVVVHQMARVGSKTIRWAVRDNVPGVRSLHTHYLNQDTIERMHAQFVRMYEHTGRPVARTVSAFFRHLPLNHPELGDRFHDDPDNVAKLIELFRRADHLEDSFAPDWFDREVRDVFGVDVFDRPYPTDGLGCVYSCDAGSLLVLRTEDLASRGAQALGAFLGTEPIGLKHLNRTTDRSYARTYRRFMAELRLPPEYLDRMYGSKLTRHFYTQDEISAFRGRWTVDA